MTNEVPFAAFKSGMGQKECTVDMMQVVGKCDILFVCLDTLRYDAAVEEEKSGGTPVLNRYGAWEKRQAPGNFTYPSHHAIFSGFLPLKEEAKSLAEQEMLFFPKSMGRLFPMRRMKYFSIRCISNMACGLSGKVKRSFWILIMRMLYTGAARSI